MIAITTKHIRKDEILSKVSQEEIIHKLTGINPIPKTYYFSLFRPDDSKPSMNFKWYKDHKFPFYRIYIKDWGGSFEGDCFELAQALWGCGFHDSLLRIAKEFNLANTKVDVERVSTPAFEPTKALTTIQIVKKPYKYDDYFKEFEPRDLYNANVFLCAKYFINNTCRYYYNKYDPAYAYDLGTKVVDDEEIKIYKIYHPKRRKGMSRFLTNYPKWQGNIHFGGDTLVITKSMKEILIFNKLGIAAIAPPSETTILNKAQYKYLSKRYKHIYSNMDPDRAGFHNSWMLRKLYGIQPFIMSESIVGFKGYKSCKDLHEYLVTYGWEQTKKLCGSYLKI